MSIVCASKDPWCHFSKLYTLNNSQIPADSLRRTVYGFMRKDFSLHQQTSQVPILPSRTWRGGGTPWRTSQRQQTSTGPFYCSPAPIMTKHWWPALLDEDTGWRQPLDQEHAGGLHWRPITLASLSGLWCFMAARRFNSGVEFWCHTGLWCHNWDLSSSLENNQRRDVITTCPWSGVRCQQKKLINRYYPPPLVTI